MSKTTTDTSNIFQSSYNDLQSEFDSQETPSITFGSTEMSADEIPSSATIVKPKQKLFNFKFVKPDISYIKQEADEAKQFMKDEDDALKAEEQAELDIMRDEIKQESKEDSIIATTDESPLELTSDKYKHTDIDTSVFNTENESETNEYKTNEAETEQKDYIDIVSSYDIEPNSIEMPDMPDRNNYNLSYTKTKTKEKEPTNIVIPLVITPDDPDKGLSFSQMWAKQVDSVQRAAGGSSSISNIKTTESAKNAFVNQMKDKYNNFKNRDESNINGLDTLIGFLTIITDKISSIFGSIIFFSKKAVKYVKGDKTWRTGLGRIFTIFVLGVIFFIIFKFLF
jgi:hypothetical protein